MLKTKIIAFLLSLLLLIQILPLQQIGKALGQNQWTEELAHGDECPIKAGDFPDFNHPYLPATYSLQISECYGEALVLTYFRYAEHTPPHRANDIFVPPPDFLI